MKKGTLLVILATFFWGGTFILVKETIEVIPIDGFLTVRFLIATIILGLVIPYQQKEGLGFESKTTWYFGIILGFFLYSSYFFQTEGLARTTPAKTAFITGMNIVFLPFIGFWPFRKKLKVNEISIAILAFVGLTLMTTNLDNLSKINKGDLLVTLTALSIAYHILITEKASEIDTLRLIWVQFLTIALLSFILSLIRDTVWIPGRESRFIWFTVVITSVFATAFAFYAQTMAQKNKVPPSRIVILFTLEPVFALIIDLFVKIIPSFLSLIGMVIILISNLLYSRIIDQTESGLKIEWNQTLN